MKIALLQMQSGIDPDANAAALVNAVAHAADQGAAILFTPEMSGLLDRNRNRATALIKPEDQDQVLAKVRAAAEQHGIWVQLGSLALKGEGRLANRSFLIGPDGGIKARYDKIHLFDVDLPTGESWRESAAYAPGDKAVVADGPAACRIGLTVCYDVRFPALFAHLSEAGAQIVSVPAAFTVPTGRAHWHVLLRARAIENACWIVAAAQSGHHADGRETYGHSLVINPWGEIMLDMGEAPGLAFADIDPDAVDAALSRIPVRAHRRQILSVEPQA